MASSSSTRGLRAASCSALAMSRCARCTACAVCEPLASRGVAARSEEHTSELQSPCNLVCRLLLEKKTSPLHSTALRECSKRPRPLPRRYDTPSRRAWGCLTRKLLARLGHAPEEAIRSQGEEHEGG